MKKEIRIPIKTIETRQTRYLREAENAVDSLRKLAWELEQDNLMNPIIANDEIGEAGERTAWFYARKTIDTDVVKEPLERIEKLVKQLKEELDKLETAIVTEVVKEKP